MSSCAASRGRNRRARLVRSISLISAALVYATGALFTAPAASADTPPTPPFNQCPAIGQDTSCGLLIVINSNGSTTVLQDPSQGPFDGIEDTLIGVQNNSGGTVNIIPLSSSSSIPIFDFDFDGICGGGYVGTPAGCPFGPSGYEGPNTSLTVSDPNAGTINFPKGLATGTSTYFSLEGAVNAASIIVPRFVALGDSYSSGEGVPPYIAGTDTTTNTCHRSMGAYPELIVNRTAVPPNVEFWACSGATIRSFYQSINGEKPQKDELLGPAATLVTLGVGGNDIGFDTIGRTCTSVQPPFMSEQNPDYHVNCGQFLDQPGQLQPNHLIDELTTGAFNAQDNVSYSLKSLYADLRANAQLGRFYVIAYPNPLPLPNNVNGDCQADLVYDNGNPVVGGPFNLVHAQFTIKKSDVQWMEKVEARLNNTIKLNAVNAGFYFVDNSLTLNGHDICGNNKDHWIHGVVLKNQATTVSEASFHPTSTGQSRIADVVASAIAGPPPGGFTSKVFPGQFVQQFMPVAGGQFELIIEAAWHGSDVQLSLVSPSGVTFDRTSQGPGVIHQLQSNGETLGITNPEAGQWTVKLYGASVPSSGEDVRVDVNQIAKTDFAPVAAVKESTDRGVAPTTVQFDGSGSTAYNGATVAGYVWDFGDGTAQASGATPTHIFATAGTYTITLTVTDSNGQTDTATNSVAVAATDQPPTASFTWGALDTSNPAKMSFDASASSDVDGQIVSYAWDFGDGTSGTGVLPSHTYVAAGTYPVTLSVIDNGSLKGSLCQGVTTGSGAGTQILPCTLTSLTSSNNPAFVGQPVTFTANVSVLPPGTGVPTGSVTFNDGAISLGSVALDPTGAASLTVSNLVIGHHPVTASYSGSASFARSASATLTQLVRNNLIAFSSTRTGRLQLYTMNPDGTNQARITFSAAADSEPVLSPDGTRIAFTSTRSGHPEIWLMKNGPEGATNVATNLTKNAAFSLDPTWSPDGTKIAFTSNRSGKFQIWLMNADGTGATRLTNDSANDVTPAWSPDGTRLAFASDATGRFQIYVAPISLGATPALGTLTWLTADTATDMTPAWSPNNKLIAFSSTASGNPEVWVTSSQPGGAVVQETSNPGALEALPSWAPDGIHLTFTSTPGGQPQIFEISYNASSLGTGKVQVTTGATNEVSSWCCISAP